MSEWISIKIIDAIEKGFEEGEGIIHKSFYDGAMYVINRIRELSEQTEPTISKMEQVDKDINVRSKDEPQTDCDTCKHKGEYAYCRLCGMPGENNYEPQTERSE